MALFFSLTPAPDGLCGQRHTPAVLPPGKKCRVHCTGGRVGPRVGLDGCGHPRTTGVRSRNVQPIASRYTDYAEGLYNNYQLDALTIIYS